MSDPALCKRLAEGVMGWTLKECCALGSCYIHEDGQYGLHEDDWHPDTDIAQAMMVAERIALHLELVRYENGKWKCSIHKMVHPPASYDGARVDNPAAAISLAADAWLRQGGGGR